MVLAMAKPAATAEDRGVTGARVCVAAVAAAHGVRGLVRLKPFTVVPEDCIAYGPLSTADGSRRFAPEFRGMHKGQVLVHIEGVEDRDAAESLRGTRLYVDRAALPPPADEEEFYHADLLGLEARLSDGSMLGTVRAVYDFGAGDALEVIAEGARPLLIPFTRETVPTVDLAGGVILVEPAEGLLDEVVAGEEGAE